MVKKKFNLVVTSIIFTLSLSFSINVYASSTTNRISGLNRYATSASVALAGWQQSDYAVLANGEDFPDALSAAPLAKKYNAPILLTQKNVLPTETTNTLQQLKVKNVFVVGGTGVVSSTVENQLTSMGIVITRLAGQDRYETDIKVAKQLDNATKIAIVTGEDFPDALSIAPIAVKENMPIILVAHNAIPDVVKNYISSQSISKIYVIGSGSSLDSTITTGLSNVELITGSDKYQRNLAIIDKFKSDLDLSNVYVATGENFADALSGSILAGKNGNPMLLVGDDAFSSKDYLDKNSINMSNVNILGGTGAVKDSVINYLTGGINEAEFYYNRAKEYSVNKDFDKAIADYSKAMELDPNDYVLYYDRGLAYQEKGSIDNAISDYSKSIELNPDYIYAYNNRANIYYDEKQYDKAIADYKKILLIDPNMKSDAAANAGATLQELNVPGY